MDLNLVKNKLPTTPAFIVDEKVITTNLIQLFELKKQAACHVLYSIKALPLAPVLKLAKNYCDGFSVSSLNEARLAKEILADKGTIHITTPGLRDNEFGEITDLCSHISFNSISQYQRLLSPDICNTSIGVRVNPKLSFVNDLRFDPCRPYSKLGMDFDEVPETIDGLHFHTVFSNTDLQSLEKTLDKVKDKLGRQFKRLKWLNLGGGYLFHTIKDHQPFIKLVQQLKKQYDIDVFIEPGKGVVGNAGYIVTTVIDCFISDGKQIAVLDTSVNHNPEVFEYQKQPELFEAEQGGKYSCVLVGSSCLAGDVFGEYQFNKMPVIGDRLVFLDVGAYSLIKANKFNGYDLPDVYLLGADNKLTLYKQSTYQDYRQQWI